jgi:hypothetical protein
MGRVSTVTWEKMTSIRINGRARRDYFPSRGTSDVGEGSLVAGSPFQLESHLALALHWVQVTEDLLVRLFGKHKRAPLKLQNPLVRFLPVCLCHLFKCTTSRVSGDLDGCEEVTARRRPPLCHYHPR